MGWHCRLLFRGWLHCDNCDIPALLRAKSSGKCFVHKKQSLLKSLLAAWVLASSALGSLDGVSLVTSIPRQPALALALEEPSS